MTTAVLAAAGRTNAELIADVHQLGYIGDDDMVLDPTFGHGRWWTEWRPHRLVAHDLDPAKSPAGVSVDFTDMSYLDGTFDVVAFDPPYKLNGTPSADVDERYGVHVVRSRDDRHRLILDGITECTRVLRAGGRLLVKCQDQVNGGKVRWQTDIFTRHAETLGLVKVDALHLLAYRPQPEGRRQLHARRNLSTLLVFVKPESRRLLDRVSTEPAGRCLPVGSPSAGGPGSAAPLPGPLAEPGGGVSPGTGDPFAGDSAQASTAASTSPNDEGPGRDPRADAETAAAALPGSAA